MHAALLMHFGSSHLNQSCESQKWYIYRAAAAQSMQMGDYSGAISCWLSALEEAEDFGDSNPQLTTTLEGLAEALWVAGNTSLASSICRRLIRIYETKLGRNHHDVGIIARNLGMIYHRGGRLEESVYFFDRAMKVLLQTLGASDPDVQNITANLAQILRILGRHNQAEMVLKNASQPAQEQEWRNSGSWQAYDPDEDLLPES